MTGHDVPFSVPFHPPSGDGAGPECWCSCSKAIRTARSRTSGDFLRLRPVPPSAQGMKPLGKSARFRIALLGLNLICERANHDASDEADIC